MHAGAARRQILVFVEGKRTEEGYIRFWAREHRDKIIVNIDERRADPMSLVRRAIDRAEWERREERRQRGSAHDEVWCVFDVDTHPRLAEAMRLADRHGIRVAVSNPCIELWFVLHFEDQTAEISSKAVQARSAEFLKCKKTLTHDALALLADRHDEAATRARALDKKHAGDGRPRRSNPSSELWRLIDAIVRPPDLGTPPPPSRARRRS